MPRVCAWAGVGSCAPIETVVSSPDRGEDRMIGELSTLGWHVPAAGARWLAAVSFWHVDDPSARFGPASTFAEVVSGSASGDHTISTSTWVHL